MYKFLEHTADVKVHVEAKSLEELFSESSKALLESIYGKLKIKEEKEREIDVEGEDLESLLYNFLEEFVFLLEAKGFLVSQVKEIKIDEDDFSLKAKVVGDDLEKYSFVNDVKAVTYSEMFVRLEEKKKWISEFVLDV